MNRTIAGLAGLTFVGFTACGELEGTGASAILSPRAPASVSSQFPDAIATEISSEGIAVGTGHTFYVGNLRPTFPNNTLGSIYVGDLRTGEIGILRANDGPRPTAGMKYDDRSGYLFTARGTSGGATVVDGATGATVAEMQFAVTSAASPSFVNDVIITRAAAYFTDSRRAVIYRVPLGAAGELLGGFEVVPLTGEFVQGGPTPCLIGGLPGPLFANGIEATPNGEWLIINSLANGLLYRVDPATGDAKRIDLGNANVCLADGNLLAGRTLYVMQNLTKKITVVSLDKDYLSGTVERHILVGGAVMTTMARHGHSIYAVSAGFGFLAASDPHRVLRFDMH